MVCIRFPCHHRTGFYGNNLSLIFLYFVLGSKHTRGERKMGLIPASEENISSLLSRQHPSLHSVAVGYLTSVQRFLQLYLDYLLVSGLIGDGYVVVSDAAVIPSPPCFGSGVCLLCSTHQLVSEEGPVNS